MYPNWLLEGLEFPQDEIEELLRAAQQAVPADLIEERGAAEELRTCAEFSYRHLWLSALCQVGWFAEETGRDDEFPQPAWLRLAQVAHVLEYPEMVPYCLGKAKRLPRQDPADLIAGFVLMPAAVPSHWRESPPELEEQRARAEHALRQDDSTCPAMIDAGDLAGLAGQLRNGAYDRNGQVLSEAFSTAFDDVFEVVTAKDFPAEQAAFGWAVIGPNPFQVVLNDGPFNMTTRAEVWWRAD